MSTLENNKLIENAFESFITEIQDNYDFESFVQENYFTFADLWRTKEHGRAPEESYDNAFTEILEWDFEGALFDIIQTAKNHATWRNSCALKTKKSAV